MKELDYRKKIFHNLDYYSRKFLKIRTKSGQITPLKFNSAQKYIHQKLNEQKKRTGKVRAVILKGRQMGCSTYVSGRYYHITTHDIGMRTFILTHEIEATNNLFEIVTRFNDHMIESLKPHAGKSNRKELVFDMLDSGYRVGTAGSKGVGRSGTIQLFHGSEIAFWPHAKEHMAGIIQSIADKPGTEIILESTANGMGNIFHKFWQQAEVGASRYQAIFVPWYWQKEYFVEPESGFAPTDEEKKYMQVYELNFGQIAWRRQKIIELGDALLFKQEYPATAAEAFQMTGIESFIGADAILAARKRQVPISARQAVIAGFDPARDGNDRDSFIYRAGPCAFGLKYLPFKNFGERVNFCIEVLKKDDPYITKLFIDYGGSGWELGGLLTEAGYKERIKIVNFGSAAMNKNAYVNKRAEIYGEMKKWLIDDDIPACIPDSDSLHADLQATGYSYDSKSRLKLERKAEIKKRGLRSPDGADALALTFSFPIRTMTVKAKPLPVESYFN